VTCQHVNPGARTRLRSMCSADYEWSGSGAVVMG